MSYVEWERDPIMIPKGFEIEPPIFQVIEGYKLDIEDFLLKADKCFSLHGGDSYRVSYNDFKYGEIVNIHNFQISWVSNLILPNEFNRKSEKISIEEQVDIVWRYLSIVS